MPRMLLASLFALIALSHQGCTNTPRGELFRPAMLGPDQAVIYVFRQAERAARSGPVSVFINQQFEGELRPGEHLAQVVPPGEYLVRVEASASMVIEVRVAAGNVAYERVTMKRRSRPVVEDVEPDLGRRLIAGTRRVSPPEEPSESEQAARYQSAAR